MSIPTSKRLWAVGLGLTMLLGIAGCATPRRAYVGSGYGVQYGFGNPYYGAPGYYDQPGYHGYYAPGVGQYRYPRYYQRQPHVVVPQRAPVYVQPRQYHQPRVVIPPHRGGVRVAPPPGWRGHRGRR
ncbi:MAG: hypothetical protein M3Y87_27145 [Myxococcota bacterium]|nr:hypothetical protein [Myxococcota bacterium]